MDHTFSAPKIPQFHTKNPSVQHKSLSSTPKTPQFHPLSSTSKTPQFNTHPSVQHQKPLSSTPKTSQFKTSVKLRCVELRGFRCGTEGIWGLKRSSPFVLSWQGCGTEGDPKSFYFPCRYSRDDLSAIKLAWNFWSYLQKESYDVSIEFE